MRLVSLTLGLTLSMLLVSYGHAKNLKEQVESLGGNKKMIELSQGVDPEWRARVIQKRIVPRENQWEFGLMAGQRLGGDPYLVTRTVGVQVQYHFNPRYSFGIFYQDMGSQLSVQGERAFSQAQQVLSQPGVTAQFPEIDPPQMIYGLQGSFYPIYGKMNVFNLAIVQFDWSLQALLGQSVQSQSQSIYGSLGTGLGFWVTHNLAIRTDLRWEWYQDQDSIRGIRRTLNPLLVTAGVGFFF